VALGRDEMTRPKAEVYAELSTVACYAADPLLETLAALLMPGETVTNAVGIEGVRFSGALPQPGALNGAVELPLLTPARIVKVTIDDHSYMCWKDVVSIDKEISEHYLDVTIHGVKGAGYLNVTWARGWNATWNTKRFASVVRQIDAKIYEMKSTPQ
jgi:hypothetical protein